MNVYIKESEKRLLASLNQLTRRGAAQSIVFYFSKLVSKRKNDNFSIVINVIKDSLKQQIGDIFVLTNSDVIVVHHGRDINILEGLIKQVLYMFSGDEYIALDDLMNGQFYQTFFKDENWHDFLELCKNRVETSEPKEGIIEQYIAILEAHLQKIDWSDVVHNNNVYRFKLGEKNKIAMREVTFSQQVLEVLAGRSFDICNNVYLSHFMKERIDIQLLIFAMQLLDTHESEPLIINLRLSTTQTPEFEAFINFVAAKSARQIIVAIDIGDALSNFPAWLAVRDRLLHLKIDAMLDNVDLISFMHIDYVTLGFDYIRICETENLKIKHCLDFEDEIATKVQSMDKQKIMMKLTEDKSQIYLENLGITYFC